MNTNFAFYISQYILKKETFLIFVMKNQFWARKPRCCESESICRKEALAIFKSGFKYRAGLIVA